MVGGGAGIYVKSMKRNTLKYASYSQSQLSKTLPHSFPGLFALLFQLSLTPKTLLRPSQIRSMAVAAADAVSNPPEISTLKPAVDNANPTKYFRKFLYKAALITIFLVLPSIAPDFINQTTFHARSWELLHLIFVGIAVSYGLFSKRNDDTDTDNAQSYVSKMLQVSSVFDDESDSQTVIDDKLVQTWNSQYCRDEPVVVVAAAAAAKEGAQQKPLLLPVRSLKQQPSEGERIRAGVRRNSRKLNEDEDDDVVLRSPIPWRSRSGRMEDQRQPQPHTPPMEEEQELGNNKIEMRSLRRPSMWSVDADDVVKKKGFLPPPPPPAPPPPPQFIRKPVLAKSNSAVMTNNSTEKTFTRSVRSVPAMEEEFSESDLDDEPIKRSNSMVPEQDKKVVLGNDDDDGGELDLGPDVDKKADEFIAKFREQIRLQRIESIRRSTAQRTGRSFT